MSAPSDAFRFSDSTQGQPHSAPSSLPEELTLSRASSDKAEKDQVPPPFHIAFLLGAENDGNAGAGACSKKQEMGVEYRPVLPLPNSGHLAPAPVRSSSFDSLKSLSDGASSSCSKSGDISSSSVSGTEGLVTFNRTPKLSQIPRIADQSRETIHVDLRNHDNSNRDVEVIRRQQQQQQQQQQIGGNHRRVSSSGRRRIHTSDATNGAIGGGSHLGHYVNWGPRDWGSPQWNAPHGFIRTPHMRMLSPPLLAQPQPFIPAPQLSAMPFNIIPSQDPPYPYYFAPPPPLQMRPRVPFIPQVPPPVRPSTSQVPSDQQKIKLKNQIEYYFSIDNLCKDIFLRKHMDDQGWVPLSLIATFKKVKEVTESIPFISGALQGSTEVEIQGEKIRRRSNWEEWLLPSTPEAKEIIQSLCK